MNHLAHRALSWSNDVEVTGMADRRKDIPFARSVGRLATRDGTGARSAARINERFVEQLRQLGREVLHEPVPQHLVEIVQARKARGRRE